MERSLSKTLVTITIIILSIGIITILVWLAIKISKSNDKGLWRILQQIL